MTWPGSRAFIGFFKDLLFSGFGGLWIVAAAGILAAVLFHRKDKSCRLWPALPALILWLACMITGVSIRSYAGELFALFPGSFAFGYAVGWLAADLFYFLKGRKQKDTEEKTEQTAEENAEAVVPSVIEGSVDRKKSGRKSIRTASILMIGLAAGLLLLCVFKKKEYPPSYDLSLLESIGLQAVTEPVTAGGRTYLYYAKMNKRSFETLCRNLGIEDPAALGTVIAYGPHHPRQWYYYCTVDALPGGWLLMFDEDGTGIPSAQNAVYLYGTAAGQEQAPDWLKAMSK